MNYWSKRAIAAQEKLTRQGIKATEKQIQKYYANAMRRVIGQFEATYDKLISTANIGREPTPADLYKLDAYWQLQSQLRNELKRLGDKQSILFSQAFMDHFQSIYNSIALPAGENFSTLSLETVQQMINQIWCADGKSWSSRVWTNTNKLQEELNDNLIDCVLTGKKTTELKNRLQERFNVSYSRADSIVRTELAHIQTQAAQQRYKDYGIHQVEVWADKDDRRCEVCGKLHRKRYLATDTLPIPAHPRCRCCVIPVIDE